MRYFEKLVFKINTGREDDFLLPLYFSIILWLFMTYLIIASLHLPTTFSQLRWTPCGDHARALIPRLLRRGGERGDGCS